MSLYALPGPLFAPLQQNHQLATNRSEPKKRVLVDFSKVELDTSLKAPRKALCRNYSDESSTTDHSDLTGYGSSASSSSCSMHDQHLKIRVKDAKLDFYKLARPKANATKTCCRRQPNGRLQRRRQEQAKAAAAEQHTYENALVFELEISFVGRTYTTKRTLQQIAQFRSDLTQDLQIQQQWMERSSKHKNNLPLLDDGSSLSSSTSSTDSNDSTMIPDLPRMSDEGVYGCGFAQMGGMLQSYRPSLEQWFHQVVDHASEADAILADFLWEPLSAKCMDELHSSLTELGPIDE
ncbi:expressed unknown protein [Seminavis robusta]|uniref:Uncharacterized protein n=1 Tax=Seminavis robusta TaxID=568900 RepID=A0A9N8HYB7_9STRA|nr:expressed unknown protein [Seminavis robusta]|eukprot:Sro3882_g351660.1 n/a (293) ;mRNA; r:1502-2380